MYVLPGFLHKKRKKLSTTTFISFSYQKNHKFQKDRKLVTHWVGGIFKKKKEISLKSNRREMEKMNKFQRGTGPMKWLTGGNISELLVRWQNEGDGSLVMGFPMLPESSMPHYGIEEAEPTIDPRRSTQVKTKGILGEIKCDMRWVRWCRALA